MGHCPFKVMFAFGWPFSFFSSVCYISSHRSMHHIGPTSSGHKHGSSLPHATQEVGKLTGKKEKLELLLVTCPFCFSLFFLCVPVPFYPLTHNKILCCLALACLYFWRTAAKSAQQCPTTPAWVEGCPLWWICFSLLLLKCKCKLPRSWVIMSLRDVE